MLFTNPNFTSETTEFIGNGKIDKHLSNQKREPSGPESCSGRSVSKTDFSIQLAGHSSTQETEMD